MTSNSAIELRPLRVRTRQRLRPGRARSQDKSGNHKRRYLLSWCAPCLAALISPLLETASEVSSKGIGSVVSTTFIGPSCVLPGHWLLLLEVLVDPVQKVLPSIRGEGVAMAAAVLDELSKVHHCEPRLPVSLKLYRSRLFLRSSVQVREFRQLRLDVEFGNVSRAARSYCERTIGSHAPVGKCRERVGDRYRCPT